MARIAETKILLGASALVIAASLVACGPQDGGEGAPTEPDSAAAEALEGFEPNVSNDDTQEPYAEEMPEGDDWPEPGEESDFAVDPTTAMTFDPDHGGEDLYQRGFYEEAIAVWQEDAEAGDAYAAYRLGVEYFDGQVVERDLEAAARYQRMAAELGNPAAMFELASFYETGLGVDTNVIEAGSWYLAAAERGFPPAQHNIATMYEDGVGVPQDYVQAYIFYTLAVEQGFRVNFERDNETGLSVFVDPREHLITLMSEEQVAEAEAALEDLDR